MKIQYVGHSCFLLCAENGTRILTDPYDGVGIAMPNLHAAAVTVSHNHFDHNNVRSVNAPLVFNQAGEYSVGGVKITAQKSFHDDAQGKKRGENLIFGFEIDGVTVYHLGDLGEAFTPERAKTFENADVLLIPVGGTYTITAKEAQQYIKAAQPKIVIPMHYRAEGISLDIAPVDEFLRGYDNVTRVSGELELHKETLKNQIILMDRYAYGK